MQSVAEIGNTKIAEVDPEISAEGTSRTSAASCSAYFAKKKLKSKGSSLISQNYGWKKKLQTKKQPKGTPTVFSS
jgi:hypothetical protein